MGVGGWGALHLRVSAEPALLKGPCVSMADRERGLSSIRASGGLLLADSSIPVQWLRCLSCCQ